MAARNPPQTTNATLTKFADPEHLAETLPEPWENAAVLEHYYNDQGLSVDAIATETFGGDVCPETVRRRLHAYDVIDREPTLAERLEATNPEDIGLSEQTDDSHARFSLRGRSA